MKGLLLVFLVLSFFSLSCSADKKWKNWLDLSRRALGKESYCWVVGNNELRAKYILATNQKDEEHLNEWIAHHLLLGFDGILIFDDYSKDPVWYLDSIPKEAREKVLVFLRCPRGQFIRKAAVQTMVANQAGSLGAKWVWHLDADEYLAIKTPNFQGVGPWFDTFPDTTRQVACNWIMYGSSFRDTLEPNELLMRANPYRHGDLHPLVKSAQRPPTSPYINWRSLSPHTMVPMGTFAPIPPGGSIVFRTEGRDIRLDSTLGDGGQWAGWPTSTSLRRDVNTSCFIAHYFTQSLDTCYKRKIQRPRDDVPEYRSKANAKKICNHEFANEVFDPDRMGVYADAVDKFMIPLMNRTKGWQLDDLDGFSLPFYNSPGMQFQKVDNPRPRKRATGENRINSFLHRHGRNRESTNRFRNQYSGKKEDNENNDGHHHRHHHLLLHDVGHATVEEKRVSERIRNEKRDEDNVREWERERGREGDGAEDEDKEGDGDGDGDRGGDGEVDHNTFILDMILHETEEEKEDDEDNKDDGEHTNVNDNHNNDNDENNNNQDDNSNHRNHHHHNNHKDNENHNNNEHNDNDDGSPKSHPFRKVGFRSALFHP